MIYIAILFILLALAEWRVADRPAQPERWVVNGALGLASLLIGRLSLIAGPIAAAVLAERYGLGLLNLVSTPSWLAGAFTIIAMDCAVYWQHRAFHKVDWLWRWHSLHHADKALDLSTGVRFHPVEAIVSLVFKAGCVILLGAPIWAVPLFELWLMAGSLIEHSNIRVPRDSALRWLLVTPGMHRVHHSAHGNDAQHNFGFAISAWDRIFGSYKERPSGENIGLPS